MKTLRIPILGRTLFLSDKNASAVFFEPELRGQLHRGENTPITWGYGTVAPKRSFNLGKLSEKLFSRDIVDVTADGGILLSRRVVTDAGVAFLVDDWDNNSTDITNFNAHANGTGVTAEAATQTALVLEVGTRQAGIKSQPTAPQIRSVATIAQGATNAITEHGLFDSTVVAGSTLWDRSVFAAINVQNGDSIEFTYTLTVNSGG